MRFVVFGAAGSVGREVVAEALARGHDVTAVVRSEARLAELPAEVSARLGDAANVDDVAALIAGHDVAVTATRPHQGRRVSWSRRPRRWSAASRARACGCWSSAARPA